MSLTPPRKSRSKAIADAIAAAVSREFTLDAKSILAPRFALAKIERRQISVWPAERRVTIMTRGTQNAVYEIAIAILEPIPQRDTEDILGDELLELVERIGSTFLGQSIVLASNDHPLEVEAYEHLPLYERELLEQKRIFCAAITLTLTTEEDLPLR